MGLLKLADNSSLPTQFQGLGGSSFRGDKPLTDADVACTIAMAVEVWEFLNADWLQDANQTISVSTKKYPTPLYPLSLLSAALPDCQQPFLHPFLMEINSFLRLVTLRSNPLLLQVTLV